MSSYGYDGSDGPRRHRSNRERRRAPPAEYTETTYVEARNGSGRPSGRHMELVRRDRDDSDLDVEEVQRDFPPGDRGYVRQTTVREAGRRARSAGGRRGYDDDYAQSRRSDGYDDRRTRGGGRRRRDRYDSSSTESSASPPPRRERRKSLGEQALAALGIGGAAGAAAASHRSRSKRRSSRRSSRRRDYSDDSDSDSRSRGGDNKEKYGQIAKAALTAAAAEAFRARKEPGGWTGEKGRRVLTAAISAGGVDGLLNKDGNDRHGKRHILESTLAGLATNRIVNGPRSRSRGGRGRSSSRGGLGDLAAGGALAAIGKQVYDRVRSKSRGRRRSSSRSSYDSRSPSPRKRRSQSVSGYLDKGLAALGLGAAGGAAAADDRRRSRRAADSDSDDDYRSSRGGPRGGGSSREVGPPRSNQGQPRGGAGGAAGGQKKGGGGGSSSDSSSDLPDSDEEMKERKKIRGKELLTAGLATVATIHAAHSIYQGYEGRKERHKQVVEGEMSPEESKRLKRKALWRDAAAVGIAGIGIKSAYGEWKEMQEQRHEFKEFEEKRMRHHERRVKLKEKQSQQSQGGGQGGYGSNDQFRRSEPNLAYGYGGGPAYYDGNPYAAGALPPPPRR